MSFLHNFWRKLQADSHVSRRWRAIVDNVATSMADRVVTGVCSLAQVPLAIGCLGKEAFGLWMTLTAVVAAMAVADMGLSMGLQNRLADAFGRDQPEEVRQAWKTGTLMLAGVALVILGIAVPCCWLVDWAKLFKVADPQVAQSAPTCLAIMLAAFGVGLPLTTAHRLALAVQLGWMANLKSSVQAIITLALVALAAWRHLDLAAFLLVVAVPPALANLLLLILLRRKLGWHVRPAPPFSRIVANQIAGKNLLFALPQLGSTALAVVPSILLSSQLGAVSVTPWNLMQRLLSLPPQVQQMFLAPLWPAYTEANARGDLDWVRATYRRSLWLSLWVAVLPILSFALWGRWALALWTRQSMDTFDQWLLLTSCVWTAVQALSFPVASLLNAHGWIVGQAIYGSVSVVVGLALMPWAIRTYGTAGVPLSLVTAFLPLSLPLALWEAHYRLAQKARAVVTMRAAGLENA